MPTLGTRTGETIGHFFIDRKLGEGGMGAVYLGEDLTLSRRVAIKFLNRHQLVQQGNERLREGIEQRFIREARSAAAINHPNLAQIYEANFDSGEWYIAMEYIEGASLFDHLTEGKRFSPNEIIQICQQIVSGLDYAWVKNKIIHRDIKPHNIMLTHENQVKIVDLGLAKPMESDFDDFELPELTHAGTPVGTPQYMAPEQATGQKDINYLVDVYALGVTLYELCSGKKAFNEKTAPMIYMAQMQKQYRPIRELNRELPNSLSHLIDSMLEPKPEDRISSYTEILNILKSCSTITADIADQEIEKSATLLCPQCSAELWVESKHIGTEMQCPQCQSILEIPNFTDTPSGSPLPSWQDPKIPILDTFSEDMITLLKEDYKIGLDKIKNLQCNHNWELAVAAEILDGLIHGLPSFDSVDGDALIIQEGWKQNRSDYYVFVKNQFHQFIRLQKILHNLMGEDLKFVSVSHDINKVLNFTNRARPLVAQLKEFHERLLCEPIPQDKLSLDLRRVAADWIPIKGLHQRFLKHSFTNEDHHLKMHRLLIDWVPFCGASLRELISKLRQSSHIHRHPDACQFQYSFMPPTLYHLYFLVNYLDINFFSSQSLQTDLTKE